LAFVAKNFVVIIPSSLLLGSDMTRHLANLDRLCNKLQQRYGAEDPLCLEVKDELEIRKAGVLQSDHRQNWSIPYRLLIKDRSSEFMRPV